MQCFMMILSLLTNPYLKASFRLKPKMVVVFSIVIVMTGLIVMTPT